MTEFEGLYTAVVESGPKEIERNLSKIPSIHQQEALDTALEKAVSLALEPKVQNIKFLLKLGADPNGSSGDEGIVLSYAYSSGLDHIVELLLQAGADPNATHSNVLEQAVRKGDSKYVVRFVEAGADVNDNSKLLFSTNLISAAGEYPEIQQYLISKGANATTELKDKLSDVKVLTLADFDYPEPNYKPPDEELEQEKTPVELHTQDYSSKYFVVRGDTKNHQDLLRKSGGRFISKLKGGKGWLIPNSRREIVEQKIIELNTSQSESPEYTPTPMINSPESSLSPEMDSMIKNVISDTFITRPVVEDARSIDLYTDIGDYGIMTVSFNRPKLFYLDNHDWDSIERYLMYKMYEGSAKAKAIKEAETLREARRKFDVNTVPAAKTPRQLVINQKLEPLAKSELNKNYLQHREQLFYRANKAKFSQNGIYRNKLINTDDKEIINKNPYDRFGYEGNLLGNTLMRLRHEFGGAEYCQRDVSKTNSMIIEKYSGNKKFYVIRGDPDPDLAAKIRTIGTYRTKNGKITRGKLNLNLQGGAGWLIPHSKHKEAKMLVFNSYPNEKKLEITGRRWVKNRMEKFLEIALLFSRFRGRPEIGPEDLLFSIKDVFGSEDFLGGESIPDDHFVRSVWKYIDSQDAVISDAAIKLLWNFLSGMVLEFTQGIETYSQMKDIMHKIEASILDTTIESFEGLTERESIIVGSFNRLFRLLKKINNTETKICVTVVHMMVGKDHYEKIREIYAKKAKIQDGTEYPDEETQFRRRFNITHSHIQSVLENLPKDISKKCKLLLLTTLDYIAALENEDAISINKRLIILSQKGKQPSPTPIISAQPEADDEHLEADDEHPEADEEHPEADEEHPEADEEHPETIEEEEEEEEEEE